MEFQNIEQPITAITIVQPILTKENVDVAVHSVLRAQL